MLVAELPINRINNLIAFFETERRENIYKFGIDEAINK